jgi:hypothetical protein
MRAPELPIFVAANANGRELLAKLRPVVEAAGYSVVTPAANQDNFREACIEREAVIFDASIEAGHIYDAATGQPMISDNVLVVSRTYLPSNFFGLRQGGAPQYPGKQPNKDIVAWVRDQLADMPPPGSRARPEVNFEKGKSWLWNLGVVIKAVSTYAAIPGEDARAARLRANAEGKVFLSYRCGATSEQRDVRRRYLQQLADEIRGGRWHGAPRSVFYYRPGAIAYDTEILPEARAFTINAIVNDRMFAADEIWVIFSDDYLYSWWTQAELVSIGFVMARGLRPRVRFFDPLRKGFIEPPPDVIPRLTGPQVKRLERIFETTDPQQMGPGAVEFLQDLKAWPLLRNLPRVRDEVSGDDYWNRYILHCPALAPRQKVPPIDVDAFLSPSALPSAIGVQLMDLVLATVTAQTTRRVKALAARLDRLIAGSRWGKEPGDADFQQLWRAMTWNVADPVTGAARLGLPELYTPGHRAHMSCPKCRSGRFVLTMAPPRAFYRPRMMNQPISNDGGTLRDIPVWLTSHEPG